MRQRPRNPAGREPAKEQVVQPQPSGVPADAQVNAALLASNEPGNPLKRFYRNLPPWPLCSKDPRQFGVIRCPRDSAIAFPHVGPNSHRRVSYIALDVDEVGAAFLAEDVGLPWPTLAVVNPRTAHAHLLYELSDPIYPGCSERADWLLDSVRKGLTRGLDADPAYSGALVQNPLNLNWRVLSTDARYGLTELAAEISDGLSQPRKTRDVQRLDANGRNVDLFDRVRWRAYDVVATVTSQEEFSALVLHLCQLSNDYAPPLPDSEVRSTARSIAKWVWKRRGSIRRNRAARRSPVLGLEPIRFEGELRRRAIEVHQRAGAEYARARRRLNVRAAIATAVENLGRENVVRPTVSAIARRARVSRSTVYRLMGDGGGPKLFLPEEGGAIETTLGSPDDPLLAEPPAGCGR